MITDLTLELASAAHAQAIAQMSREQIERGLGWSWTPRRVFCSIADADTNVVVALDFLGRVQGFAIMSYGDEQAHLSLLAVRPAQGRRGIGTALVRWHEAAALVAGIRRINLEARASNIVAQDFYRHLAYREVSVVPGYYRGREASVRMSKELWPERAALA